MRGLFLALALAVAACGGSSASVPATPSPTAGLGDAARVWCLDAANQVKVGLAAVTLGFDQPPTGSLVVGPMPGEPDKNEVLSQDLRYWAGGGDESNPFLKQLDISESTNQSVYRESLAAWEDVSPDTFIRACLAAFEGR